jgi:hypothetical protein
MRWRRLLRPERAWQQRAAAAALVASNALAVLAYTLLSVTAASALGFTAPLLLALLGGLFLRERVSLGRWLGTLVGFVGMLLIVKPGGEASLFGIAAALGGRSPMPFIRSSSGASGGSWPFAVVQNRGFHNVRDMLVQPCGKPGTGAQSNDSQRRGPVCLVIGTDCRSWLARYF